MKRYNVMSINEWVQVIKNVTLPSFTRSVQRISALANAAEVDLEHMATAIKRDPALSTKIIRACSGVYRSRRGRINTVSRALVMLGVEEVRKISLTCALVDGLLEGEPPEELVREITSAVQAATGARLFALGRGDTHSEDVFISTLIRAIGPLALWRAAPQIAEQVSKRLVDCRESPEEAEKAVLGFTYQQLSERLAQEWGLSDYLPDERSALERDRCRASEMKYSSYLARTEHLGDAHPLVVTLREHAMNYLLISEETLDTVMMESSRETLKVAISLGVPAGEFTEDELNAAGEELTTLKAELEEENEALIVVEGNESLIFQTLCELSELLLRAEEPTLSVVKILEGMHRGIGLDRVLFAMLDDSRSTLRARLLLGEDYLRLERDFRFSVQPPHDLWTKVFQSQCAFWYSQAPKDEFNDDMLTTLHEVVGEGDFFLAPVVVNSKWVGVFYADRRSSRRSLHEEDYRYFNQLALQAGLAFSNYDRNRSTSSAR